MRKQLIFISMLLGILSYSQQTKRKVSKKMAQETVQKSTDSPEHPDVPTEEVKDETADIAVIAQEAKHEDVAQRLLKKSGWIRNRNSAVVRGIEGYVKGVYVGEGKLYVLLEIDNRTNINYDVESISFITSPIQVKNRQIESEEKVFTPIYAIQPQNIAKKSSQRLVYVFDKFTIADNKNLLFIMTEMDGERTLSLDIKPKYIVGAEYVK